MKFKYLARTTTGQSVKGEAEAASSKAVADLLREQKLMPVKISQTGPLFNLSALTNALGKASASDVTNFTRQLATMITAGLPLTDALNLLRIQSSPALSPVVGVVLSDVQSGLSLSAALAKHPTVFSKVYVALIKAGETAGIIDKILLRLADTSEKSREFRSKVLGAMIYPIIIIIGMIGVVILMMVLVIPKLSALYADFGQKLPMATQIVIGMSNFTINYWWVLVLATVGGFFAFRWYVNTRKGRDYFDRAKYKFPVMGPLAQQVMLTELTRTLSLLVGAGVSIVEALGIVIGVVSNSVIQSEVRRIAVQVEKGFPISISFSESPVFPALVGQMLAVGEETGKMDEVLQKVSSYYESESSEKIKGLTTAIEPLILILLAVVVGFLMYAIIMPIYSLMDKV